MKRRGSKNSGVFVYLVPNSDVEGTHETKGSIRKTTSHQTHVGYLSLSKRRKSRIANSACISISISVSVCKKDYDSAFFFARFSCRSQYALHPLPVRLSLVLPNTPDIHWPIPTSCFKSTPVSYPAPCSACTMSSVAAFPVAPGE